MVLRSDYCLYYYKDATKNHLGVISLRDTQFKIRVGQKSDVSWPKNLAMENTFAIVTTPRVYFMYAETRAEAEEWRKVLEDAHKGLVEVTRTKSFSGFRHNTLTVDRDSALMSHSVKVGEELMSYGGVAVRPKAHTSVTDSLASNASSVFGRQFTLSSSSDVDSPLAPLEEIDSVYNVLKHPDTPPEEKGAGSTVGGAAVEPGEKGVNLSETPYKGVPPGREVNRPRLSSSDGEKDDYVLPPDAHTPQNFSVTVAEGNQHTMELSWAEPDPKGAGLLEGNPPAALAQVAVEGFYDVAHGPENSKQQQKQQQQQQQLLEGFYDVAHGPENHKQQQQQQHLEGFYDVAHGPGNRIQQQQLQQQQQQLGEMAVYDVIGPESSPKTPPTHLAKASAATPSKVTSSALHQPLPSIPTSFSSSSSSSSRATHNHTMIYEDVPDIPKALRADEGPVYDVLETTKETAREREMTGAVYEPVDAEVGVASAGREEEEVYSEVGSAEERTPPLVTRVTGYINVGRHGSKEEREEITADSEGQQQVGGYVNVGHSSETPPTSASHTPPDPTPLLSVPPSESSCTKGEVCHIVKPQPKPRSNSRSRNVDQSPSNGSDSDQLPSDREESPSSRPIPVPRRTGSHSGEHIPSSPIPAQQKKFTPPPSPRSPRSPSSPRPRPPSPLISDRRASGASDISSHSSASSNPGNEGYLATSPRQRSASVKEKVSNSQFFPTQVLW